MAGLFSKSEKTKEGKYLVMRRDGTVPPWMYFVMGSKDQAAPAGLRGYADKAEELGMDPQYVADVRELADKFEADLAKGELGDPDSPPHRKDDPSVIARMHCARGA